MNPQPHASSREVIVATAIQPVVRELRLIDIADYIAFIRLEHFSAIADLVDSAAELYFMPGALRLGLGGEAHVCWTGSPRIVLDLELRPEGAVVYFQLSMTATNASVEVHYVSFEKADTEPEKNTAYLAAAIEQAMIKRTVPRAEAA
ncbi:MAG: hypothetical protein ABS58_08395 [Mesorhizobium sp. SCN 65-20]|nr:MAG: hypothetical protein ABS58_08395 [Mesorhizobium sp. SCN 65-20]